VETPQPPPTVAATSSAILEIGILTMGKPTLSMALTSLLLQEPRRLRIHIVDTSERPVINHEDFSSAMRLAFDRGIPCTYEHSRERHRAFSAGRRALLEALTGPHLCFMDDDVVLPGSALRQLTAFIDAHPDYGYLAPVVKNAALLRNALGSRIQFTPGTVFRQDAVVRKILLDYYSNTTDVLDKQKAGEKVWEIGFLTELFPLLGRPGYTQGNNVIYHLDYHERPNWDLMREDLLRTSRHKAEDLVRRYAGAVTPLPSALPAPGH
jgi:glycosyltransferase involved in cell wall biosynthesis